MNKQTTTQRWKYNAIIHNYPIPEVYSIDNKICKGNNNSIIIKILFGKKYLEESGSVRLLFNHFTFKELLTSGGAIPPN